MTMNRLKRIDYPIFVLFLVLLPILLTSCRGQATPASPTPQPETVLTAAAETANARLTEQAKPSASQTPMPSDTPAAPTANGTLTLALTPTTGFTPTTLPSAAPSGLDRAEYSGDITVPDGTDFKSGEAFTKTWRLRNAGTSTWTTDYALAFIEGAQMAGPTAVPLTSTVPPGQTIDISVPLVAPQDIGAYRGFWGMRNSAGQLFESAVYVEIDVVSGSPGTPTTPGTPGPTNTPGPTKTPGGAARVSDVSISVDDTSADTCPHTFSFTGSFDLSAASPVTYLLEAGSDTPGFTFDLPSAETVNYEAGTRTVLYTLNISSAMSGWARFHVTAPNDVVSNQVDFTVTCAP
jgi:hypothetical protein